ncbi:FRG domain-containing protein [Sphingobacterium faecium]|uniref:FRG domain-containing protein n=1 Tax=Sphingobacterium faecium TaxID=34087 RepID=UPI001291F837|nr:FRG domain-containing protein [Sphingobacterium faecium]MQP30288.1 FRG domain-containing protein [Sphingobacterium faecium]
MRKITGHLTPEILDHYKQHKNIAKADAFPVKTYRELTEIIAKLSYLNKDHLLFFRGQKADYKNSNDLSTFYPTIYREDYLLKTKLDLKFEKLEVASKLLVDKLIAEEIQGNIDIKKRKLIQWSILQHYEVIETPLIDVTQSLRVACSFSFLNNTEENAFIYVFGLPYYNNRISHNSEHDLVNIRLLSISPPDALRPYFQEGFLVGTDDITTEYENKGELDLNNRLIAKIEIPNNPHFWGDNFSAIPESALYPEDDRMLDICSYVKEKLSGSIEGTSMSDFIKLWSSIEKAILEDAQQHNPQIFTFLQALRYLQDQHPDRRTLLKSIDTLRPFRNKLVHDPLKVTDTELIKQTQKLRTIIENYN